MIYRTRMTRYRLTTCFVFLLGGCWRQPCPGDLIVQGVYSLDANTDEVTGVEATVIGQGQELVVSGRLTARHHPNGPVSAAGQVTLVAPDGQVLFQQPLEFRPSPHARHIHPPASFALSFPALPPVGTTVRIRFEKTPHDPATNVPPIR